MRTFVTIPNCGVAWLPGRLRVPRTRIALGGVFFWGIAWLAIACLAFACGGNRAETATQDERPPPDPTCPAPRPAPDPLPGIAAEQHELDYWLARQEALGLDRPLLRPVQVAAHNRAVREPSPERLVIDRASLLELDRARLEHDVHERLAYLRERLDRGDYVDAQGKALPARVGRRLVPHALEPESSVRVVLAPTPVRCGPVEGGLYKMPVDLAFDRNNCSTARPQEPLRVLGRGPNGMRLVRTRYTLGWIAAGTELSPPLGEAEAGVWLRGALYNLGAGEPLAAPDGATLTPAALQLPSEEATGATELVFADGRGVHRLPKPASATPAARPLTRRAVLQEAFARLGRPYGWGGQDAGLDCSRFVMDIFASFGLELPRNSGHQAHAGTYRIDVSSVQDPAERLRYIDAAHEKGVVLLQMPGHIMLYLGRDARSTPMAIHAAYDYLEPCEGEGDAARLIRKVAVSDLSLGEHTARGSYLARITSVVLFGQTAGPAAIGLVQPRPATPPDVPETCRDSLRVRVFRSPARPHPGQPLRVFVTASRELGPMALSLVQPSGRRIEPAVQLLGGPPFTYWAEVPRPGPGRWTVLLGDGPYIAACERFTVSRFRPEPPEMDPEAVWTPRWKWEDDTEGFFSAFVEQLFNFPVDEDLTWSNLDALLRDPAHNTLYNHLSQNEDRKIHLRPDCADLPYFLRTYFAWKLRLPFGYRRCTRGRHGVLPTCDALETPARPHEYADEVDAFRWFIRTQVKRGVHSASGRTHPENSETALYPVPLTRRALRPGTVFADPYGHLLVVAKWLPQGADGYGVLVGADAQPDGTIGRRRFWRGSFLFHPDTTHVGAGFKAWRPVLYDKEEATYSALANPEITRRRGYVPFSLQQYRGTTDDFYERMESLINPRALDAIAVQVSLIDALEEAVARRVVSVDNGERWVAQHPGKVMEMPDDGAIFQTGGPWEEFSTPSRDMRLLIAMDTVSGFPEVAARNPDRFGLTPENLEAALARIRERQREELAKRTFTIKTSDGAEETLSLLDVVSRAPQFEVAYNPNDCIEIRWGTPPDAPAMGRCQRHAPAEQREKMASYRSWFATRQRPIW